MTYLAVLLVTLGLVAAWLALVVWLYDKIDPND